MAGGLPGEEDTAMQSAFRTFRTLMVAMLVSAGLLAAIPQVASAHQGASDAAHQCQKDGWQALIRTNGTSFANQGECVSYAAQDGAFATPAIDIEWSYLGGEGYCHVTITVSGFLNGEYTVGFDGLGTFGRKLVVTNGSGVIDGDNVADAEGFSHGFVNGSTVTAVVGAETATSFVSCQQNP
jgi:hypothetical protein